ncbi:LysR family transcriptional regulator [Hyphobacterium sp.]|uniref:LysR family transcriptional regulator n=1 Tax=Hyphobacterium sp. TaxID=2004662 RepID=UPI003BA861B0
MLNFNHLRYFWAVAREGRLTAAAARLNISQSALSTQIKTLEDRIGQALFERRGRRLILTRAGQIAFEYAETIFSAGEELLARLNQSEPAGQRRVRIGALSTLSRNFQVRLIRQLMAEEGVSIVIRSGGLDELLAALKAHRLDIVLVNQVPLRDAATRWTAHVLDTQGVSLIGTPARLAGRTNMIELLSTEPLVLPTAESGYRNGVDILLQQLEIHPSIAAEVDDMAMLRLLARDDLGVAVLPPIVVADELANGTLIEACPLPDVNETFAALIMRGTMDHTPIGSLLEKHQTRAS